MEHKELQEHINTLLELIKENPEWQKKVTDLTAGIINQVLKFDGDLDEVLPRFHMNMDDLRSNVLTGIYRIRSKSEDVNYKFGPKVDELFFLIEEIEDWEDYVGPKTAKIVKTVYQTQSMNDSIKILDMKYPTIRAHLLRASELIRNKEVNWGRKSTFGERAQELFTLVDETPDWEKYVTKREAMLVNKFREVGNFYELAEMLNIQPGNIAGTLYGTTQKIGVIGKLKEKLPQTRRRNIDKKPEEA